MILELQKEDAVFMSYKYGTLFGLIRISEEAIYVFSVYNTEKKNGNFNDFVNHLEEGKKPIIFLNVKNSLLHRHFTMKRNYYPYKGKIKDTGLGFEHSLIKHSVK